MIFVFHILVFTIFLIEIHNFSIQGTKNFSNGNETRSVVMSEDVSEMIPDFFFKHNSHRKLTSNYTNHRKPNLKSNVFDKMLSDEMLSMKQQSHEKDMTYSPSILTWNKASIPTPTLELKQKWPVIEFLANSGRSENDSQENNDSQGETRHVGNSLVKNSENKVLGLRSLVHESLAQPHGLSVKKPHGACSCMMKSPTSFNHQTDPTKICTHTDKYEVASVPSSLPYTPYPAFYVPFQSYYVTAVTDDIYKYTYYQPYIMNNLNHRKKKKHRKTTTLVYSDDLYYDKEIDDYLGIDMKKDKHTHSKTKLHFYEDDKNKDPSILPDVTSDKFVEHTAEELNRIYSDSFIKKCFCTSSTRRGVKISLLSSLFACLHFFF
ncbi:uncharacterized protein LOC114239680 [Bombyx mandarina]|uniref:Uncharacterized protein LOC114239680 n=1 Tax=Bombyx mandarina TaxID=7092 RepID=A0A6J2J917_BOMMA|nr:uncharacterized protein LOC114239680 [Bombyx mandarina]